MNASQNMSKHSNNTELTESQRKRCKENRQAALVRKAALKEKAEKPGEACKAILSQLNAELARETQLKEQVQKEFLKLEATKAKLVEQSTKVLATTTEKERLFQKHGHAHAGGEALFTPPPPPAHFTPEQQSLWTVHVQEQYAVWTKSCRGREALPSLTWMMATPSARPMHCSLQYRTSASRCAH